MTDDSFQAIDVDNVGFVEADYVKTLLEKMGSGFRNKELDAFLNVAKDQTTGKIYYEDYASLYASQVDQNARKWKAQKLPEEDIFK